jgi:hypothetical protein
VGDNGVADLAHEVGINGLMNSLNTLQTINPSPDEIHAVYAAFGDLPKMDALQRLVMIRRAVAAGFYTDKLHLPRRRTKRNRSLS